MGVAFGNLQLDEHVEKRPAFLDVFEVHDFA